MNMNLIFRCLTVLLTLIGNEAAFASSGIGNTLDFGELAAFPGAEGYGRMTTGDVEVKCILLLL